MQSQTYRTTFEFDQATMATLRQLAFNERLPMTRVVKKAVADYSQKRQAKPAKNFNQLWQEIRSLAKTANKNTPKDKDLTQVLVEERDKRYYDQGYL